MHFPVNVMFILYLLDIIDRQRAKKERYSFMLLLSAKEQMVVVQQQPRAYLLPGRQTTIIMIRVGNLYSKFSLCNHQQPDLSFSSLSWL